MGSPLPKPPEQRRRRNKGQSQWAQLSVRDAGVAPALPDGEWEPCTRDWWSKLWASPMASAYQEADFDSLVRLARLKDDFAREPKSSAALPAMQQLEDRFGLSPKARRALQWEIVTADEEAAEPVALAQPLRMIKGG